MAAARIAGDNIVLPALLNKGVDQDGGLRYAPVRSGGAFACLPPQGGHNQLWTAKRSGTGRFTREPKRVRTAASIVSRSR